MKKKNYFGYIHKDKPMLEEGKEEKFIRGVDFKKRGRANINKLVGEEFLQTVLSPIKFTSIQNVIENILDKYFSNYSIKDLDNFVITEMYKAQSGNIKQ